MKVFEDGMPFFKGNLHCHSTLSDGDLSPQEVVECYRSLGYAFLALTDHRRLSPASHMDKGMLLLSGIEMDYSLAGEALHIIGIGMRPEYAHSKSGRLGPQECINGMRRHGGQAILAHPAWSLNTLATLTSLQNLTAAEVYNSVSTYPWNGDRADSSLLLDQAATHGSPYGFVASDDSHHYQGEAGRAFTMVQAPELSAQAILASMEAGRFYASQGPRFEQITLTEEELVVHCSPVETVIFYSNLVWAFGRCQTGPGLTTARYSRTANPGETFLRCQLIDAQGKSAWSSPIPLAPSSAGRFGK